MRRLIDAGAPLVKRYPNGRALVRPRWAVCRVSKINNQDGYWRGAFVVESRYDPIEVPAPPLVTRELWERAVARLKQNRALLTKNATRFWPLRGLIYCGGYGRRFHGRTLGYGKRPVSSCGGLTNTVAPLVAEHSRAPHVSALWLEAVLKNDIRQFILAPGPALAEAQEQIPRT